ncbi:MAG: hypothetical protein SOT68_07100 [Oscillospiraceae bacterium]|nr:hypothetical protein [Oscillospiraceae bacterium]MDD7278904.1 hypothetical protein [Oscillospiraceae bacterium]MDY2863946.1 hypothetical protein [Oscillospiraceae bacterium]
MKIQKMLAGFVAAAMAVTTMAVSAFASTVTLDSEYVGSWGAGLCIPKTELEAIGSDVKVTLDIETRNLANTADQFLLAPMDYDNSWTRVTDQLTSDTMVAKADGFVVVKEGQTSVEFVIPATTIATLGDSGLGFQVQNVIVKSADLEAGSPEAAYTIIEEDAVKDYCFSALEDTAAETEAAEEETEAAVEETADEAVEETAEEVEEDAAVEEVAEETEAAVEETEAPAADTTTAPAATGNTAAATIAVVMVAAGAAALVSKRK